MWNHGLSGRANLGTLKFCLKPTVITVRLLLSFEFRHDG